MLRIMRKTDMLKDYIFHYNGDLKDKLEEVGEGELTYHEHLMMEDGKHCKADVEDRNDSGSVEAYFDDGNELSVWIDELEEVK